MAGAKLRVQERVSAHEEERKGAEEGDRHSSSPDDDPTGPDEVVLASLGRKNHAQASATERYTAR